MHGTIACNTGPNTPTGGGNVDTLAEDEGGNTLTPSTDRVKA
jgi:hypothetical protein